MKKIFILPMLILMLTSCGAQVAAETPEPLLPDVVPTSDPSQTIEAAAGSEFQIVIESNPTTGYQWEIIGGLPSGTELLAKEYAPQGPMMVGSGGVDIFTFRAGEPGEVRITLGYYPPSNDPVDPQQIEEFTVTIK